jgi:lipid-A-disaccharide synthase
MKYFIIAGERSGDLHAANLIKELKLLDANASFAGMGGDYMRSQGAELVLDYNKTAFMGFWEVLVHYADIKKAFSVVKQGLEQFKPDVLVCIDYAGFNLRMAAFAKEKQIPVHFYISPKIWAWNTGRAKKIKELIDRMYVILPFEKEFYKQFDYEVDYVGNPILDEITNFKKDENFRKKYKLDDRPIIAVLPGSRKTEIESTLYRMLSILPAFSDYQFVVAGVSNQSKKYYDHFRRNGKVEIITDDTYNLLAHAHAALVASGTATLETALFNVPQVVCYAVSMPTYWIARMVIKVPYISLVNLIAGNEVVKELIQHDFVPHNITTELRKIAEPGALRQKQLDAYKALRHKIGEPGASANVAKLMYNYLKKN